MACPEACNWHRRAPFLPPAVCRPWSCRGTARHELLMSAPFPPKSRCPDILLSPCPDACWILQSGHPAGRRDVPRSVSPHLARSRRQATILKRAELLTLQCSRASLPAILAQFMLEDVRQGQALPRTAPQRCGTVSSRPAFCAGCPAGLGSQGQPLHEAPPGRQMRCQPPSGYRIQGTSSERARSKQ